MEVTGRSKTTWFSFFVEEKFLVIETNAFGTYIQWSFCCWCLVVKSCMTLVIPCTITHQAPLSMGFPRQEYWSGLPFLSPEDLPDPGIEPASSVWQADSLPLSHLGNPMKFLYIYIYSLPKNWEWWELCFIQWEILGLQAQKIAYQLTLRELLQGGEGRNKVI